MAGSVIPAFTASQTDSHIHLQVEAQGCPSKCAPRAVVDGGNVFGLACIHSHLPLVFPDHTLVDGSSKLGDEGEQSSIALSRRGNTVLVILLKQRAGHLVTELQDLQPSVFPLLEDDEQGRKEERLIGLEMLQRGVEAMKAHELVGEDGERSSMTASSSTPRPARVPDQIKTRVHECFGSGPVDAEEMVSRRVAAYEAEEKHWDEGMYLDNFVDEAGEVGHLINAPLTPPSEQQDVYHGSPDGGAVPDSHNDVHLLLLDILLAQAYDHRTTLGEATVESAWTIAVLCRSLVTSCLPSAKGGDSVSSLLIGSMRRQLSFPLYRSWSLSIKVTGDVVSSLRQRQAHSILSLVCNLFDEAEDEAMSLYSSDVLTPLVNCFPTSFSATSMDQLADQLEEAAGRVTKSQVGGNWDMEELETAAREAIAEGEGGYV